MKKIFLGFFLLFTFIGALSAFGADSSQKDWSEVLDSDQGQFAVSVKPQEKKVEVRKMGGDKTMPPHLRFRVLRENDRPFELRVHTLEKENSPLNYTGQFKQWNESYVGLVIDFSFDKKTWKRLGKIFKK